MHYRHKNLNTCHHHYLLLNHHLHNPLIDFHHSHIRGLHMYKSRCLVLQKNCNYKRWNQYIQIHLHKYIQYLPHTNLYILRYLDRKNRMDLDKPKKHNLQLYYSNLYYQRNHHNYPILYFLPKYRHKLNYHHNLLVLLRRYIQLLLQNYKLLSLNTRLNYHHNYNPNSQ